MATTQTVITARVAITSPASNATAFGPTVSIEGTAVATKTTTVIETDGTSSIDTLDLEITKVEVRLGSAALAPAVAPSGAFATWTFSAATPAGPSPLAVTALMTFRPSATTTDTRSATITLILDVAGPTLTIETPQPGELVPLAGLTAQKVIRVAGSVRDSQSGVLKVEVAPPVGAFATAALAGETWTKDITITPPLGTQRITAKATDSRGNVTVRTVDIDAALQIGSLDPASTADYLSDLLLFADQRLAGAITPVLLEATFGQRFDAARQADKASVATAPVHHARIAVEVLRTYLTTRLGATPPAAVATARTQAERRFLRTAYHAMLRALGTSDAELHAARTATDRTALAARLGLESLTAAELDAIALNPDTVTGRTLEGVYGIADPARENPYVAANVPLMLDRRLIHLRSRWQREDERTGVPIIDPDIITAADVVAGSPAVGLRTARRTQVEGAVTALRNQMTQGLAQAGSTHSAVFTTVVNGVLGAGAVGELDAIAAAERAGSDIDSRVARLQLDRPAFRRLSAVRTLAATNAVRDAEWNDVVAILVQARKRREFFPTWRQEERAASLVLSPDSFRVAAQASSLEALPAFRATAQARLGWEHTLRAREAEERTTREAFAAAVQSAEAAGLPRLRDDLITVIGNALSPTATPPGPLSRDAARDRLGKELLIDLASSGTALTTRRAQAIETLQSVLFAVRARRLTGLSPVLGQLPAPAASTWALDLTVASYTEASFDEEWRWMGAYDTWRAAMSTFVWPEDTLAPAHRKPLAAPPVAGQDTASFATGAFRALVSRLRAARSLTPAQARAVADLYLEQLRAEFPGTTLPAALRTGGKVKLTELLTDAQLAERRDKTLATAAIAGQAGTAGQDYALLLPVIVGGTFNTTFQNTKVWLAEPFFFVPMVIAQHLARSGQHLAALSWIRTVYAYDLPVAQRKIYRGLVFEASIATDVVRPTSWLLTGMNPHDIAPTRAGSYTRATILTLARSLLAFGDAEFARETPESLTRARMLFEAVFELLGLPELEPLATAQGAKLPDNPVLRALRDQARANLRKLRNGLNALGLPRTAFRQPTPFRYAVLLERAHRLVGTAQQLEAAYLSALEKADDEAYNLLRARQDIAVSQASVQLQIVRASEAAAGVVAAELQRGKAAIQRDHFQDLIDVGLTTAEKVSTGLAVLRSALNFAGELATKNALGAVFGGLALAQSIAEPLASFERRRQEWQFQMALASQDVVIADQQITLANLHADIVTQEQHIAELQLGHAVTTLDFLANKFTNAELYDWMSGVLGDVYRFFLQQATVIARLTQQQLQFERQETLPGFIRSDYWEPLTDTAVAGVDRRGLTGAEQLMRDLTQLDQYAFTTDRRRLQLSRTISLAALDPVAFETFRATGVLVFSTPTALFDRDFPGHFARLVRRVRVSVIALVPPTHGIRATLTSGAVSRVVIETDDGFATILIPHRPEEVALSTPTNATGLFELDAQPDLRPPFEGLGVDMTWQLRMPRATNAFDFDTLCDALFTVDYTALDSPVLRDQVVRALDAEVSFDRSFSIRNDFPDQWFELHNPGQSATPMRIRFRTRRSDLPPNVDRPAIQQVLVFAAGVNGTPVELTVEELRLTPTDGEPTVSAGLATTVDGIVSTRRDNGRPWHGLIGKPPVGEWELALPDDDQNLHNVFKEEKIKDLLFVLTVSGEMPPWPN